MLTLYQIDTCNFALMPYTDPTTRLVNPLDINSWGTIKSSGNSLILDCLDQKSAGGEVFIKSGTYRTTCHCDPEITPLKFMTSVEH